MQDLAHHMYLMTLEGKLHLAPLENPQNILDVGTGTGIWAMYVPFAFLFNLPSASI
jgi:ribosomal protein L11 methylase PrmA